MPDIYLETLQEINENLKYLVKLAEAREMEVDKRRFEAEEFKKKYADLAEKIRAHPAMKQNPEAAKYFDSFVSEVTK